MKKRIIASYTMLSFLCFVAFRLNRLNVRYIKKKTMMMFVPSKEGQISTNYDTKESLIFSLVVLYCRNVQENWSCNVSIISQFVVIITRPLHRKRRWHFFISRFFVCHWHKALQLVPDNTAIAIQNSTHHAKKPTQFTAVKLYIRYHWKMVWVHVI